MKTVLTTLAASMLATAMLASPAEARCWWTGYSWHCSPRHHGYWARPYRGYGHWHGHRGWHNGHSNYRRDWHRR